MTGFTKCSKIVFVDRDGVINYDPIGDYIKHWKDFEYLPGAIEGLKTVSKAGFQIIIISNQAGIGDGIYTEESLNDITAKMLKQLKKEKINVGGVYYCLHGKQANCECRKPKTGLLKKAAVDHPFQPSETYFVGDKATDVEAGKSFGLRTIFVLTGHGALDRNKLKQNNPPEVVLPSLKEAADYIVNQTHHD